MDPDVLLKIGRSLADGHPLADVVARPPARSAAATMLVLQSRFYVELLPVPVE